jgi:hypothetical protein
MIAHPTLQLDGNVEVNRLAGATPLPPTFAVRAAARAA